MAKTAPRLTTKHHLFILLPPVFFEKLFEQPLSPSLQPQQTDSASHAQRRFNTSPCWIPATKKSRVAEIE
jgi:hypothetical protein